MTGKSLEELKTQSIRQVSKVSQLMVNEHVYDRLASIATKQLGPDKFIQMAIEALRKNPKLDGCDPMSFLNAMLQSISLGLEPNTPLGHCYFIPFGKEVTFIIGYKGYLELTKRHPSVVSVKAEVVYEDDVAGVDHDGKPRFDFSYGTNQFLHHKPGPRKPDSKIVYAYCYVKLVDGEAFSVIPYEECIQTRDKSQGWQSAVKYKKTDKSPWVTHEPRMCRKTAIRNLANGGEMPLSNELVIAERLDENHMPQAPVGNAEAEAFDPIKFAAENGGASDDDMIEGEAKEVEQAQPDQKDPPKKAERKPRKPRETAKEADKEPPKTVEQKAETEDEKPVEQDQDPSEDEREKIGWKAARKDYDIIVGDMNDGMPVADVREAYKVKLKIMQRDFPGVYEDLEAQFDAFLDEEARG